MLLFALVVAVACWRLTRSDRPMTAFVYTYGFGERAGLRAWNLDSAGRWHERGPDGREARSFDVTARSAVDGCPGSLTHDTAQPGFAFFIPDIDCRAMGLRMRRDGGAWMTLGPISIASSEPPTS